MSRVFVPWRASLALTLTAASLAALVIVPSSSPAKPLPAGCKLKYGGQLISAFTGKQQTFPWTAYNAVPPGHKIADARVTWGDGTAGSATIATKPMPSVKGCWETTFTARHTYSHVRCVPRPAGQPCNQTFAVAVHYRDATPHARHALTKLRAIVVTPKR